MLGRQTRENRTEMTQPSGVGSSVIACGTGGWTILIRRLPQNPSEIAHRTSATPVTSFPGPTVEASDVEGLRGCWSPAAVAAQSRRVEAYDKHCTVTTATT